MFISLLQRTCKFQTISGRFADIASEICSFSICIDRCYMYPEQYRNVCLCILYLYCIGTMELLKRKDFEIFFKIGHSTSDKSTLSPTPALFYLCHCPCVFALKCKLAHTCLYHCLSTCVCVCTFAC